MLADLVGRTGRPIVMPYSIWVECVGEHGDVIDGGVRPGVTRSQLRAQHLVGLCDDRQQRVMSVAAFVVRAGVLLVGFGVDQRCVEVDDQIVTRWTGTRRPRPLTRSLLAQRRCLATRPNRSG